MIAEEKNPTRWNDLISGLPGSHILQTWEWGQSKKDYGWQPFHLTWRDETSPVKAAALVLERSIRLGGFSSLLRVLYVPRGPMLDWGNQEARQEVLSDLQGLARRRRAIFIKIDPEVIVGRGLPEEGDYSPGQVEHAVLSDFRRLGWRYSDEQIQFRNTVWLDLNGPEEAWLARMKQKTRYNIRLAARKGVVVRQGAVEDIPRVYRMYAETSLRDGFVIRPEEYYTRIWERFMQAGMAEILLAEVDGQVVAGLVSFYFGERAWYLYGMSREAQREKMPNYLLQWEAMRRAKERGCQVYDLWGAPDRFDETDSMWGVYRFKEGLGGQVVRTAGAWDYPSQPLFYRMYTQVLPRLLDIMRRRGKKQTRREVSL